MTEWRATATAVGITEPPSDDQFDTLIEHVPGSHQYDSAAHTLNLAWRLEGPTLQGATEVALKMVTLGLSAAFGGERIELADLRVQLASVPVEETTEVALARVFPWAEHLEIEALQQFIGELEAASRSGYREVITTIAAWKSTAGIMADPELREELTSGKLGDFGPVPEPVLPEKTG